MHKIEGASGKTADIIGVSERIAFQTNILALNAAVAAARAGDVVLGRKGAAWGSGRSAGRPRTTRGQSPKKPAGFRVYDATAI
jgi:hypothetical protein